VSETDTLPDVAEEQASDRRLPDIHVLLGLLSAACARADAIGYVVIDAPDAEAPRAAHETPPRTFVTSHLGRADRCSHFTAIGLLSGGEALERLRLMEWDGQSRRARENNKADAKSADEKSEELSDAR